MVNALPETTVTTAGTPVTINVLANNTGNGLTITSFSNPANGSLVSNGDKSFTYTPVAGFVGEDTFSYTVRDTQGAPATAEVTISALTNGGPRSRRTITSRWSLAAGSSSRCSPTTWAPVAGRCRSLP
jgi:hypothetical protein